MGTKRAMGAMDWWERWRWWRWLAMGDGGRWGAMVWGDGDSLHVSGFLDRAMGQRKRDSTKLPHSLRESRGNPKKPKKNLTKNLVTDGT